MKINNSQTNQTKEHIVATLRALSSDESIQAEFSDDQKNNFFDWSQNLIIDEKKILLPQIEASEFFSLQNLKRRHRAAVDMAACYLLFHDQKKHQHKNLGPEEQKFFDEFEKIRVLANVKNSYRGVVKNVLCKIEDDIFSGSSSLSLILLNEIFSEEILSKTKNYSLDLEKKCGKEIADEIKALAKKISDQELFSKGVVRVLDMLRQKNEVAEKEKKQQDKNQKSQNNLINFGQENIDAKSDHDFNQNQPEENSTQQIEQNQLEKISDFKEDDKGGDVSVKLDKSRAETDKIEFKNPYKIFTNKFDEIIFPQKLIDKNELEFLRDQLDLKLTKLKGISKKMSLKLKRKLLSKRASFLEYDASRGILDRKKLVRLLIDPLLEDIWVNNKTHEYQDTALTILLDNSGSMRGNPIVMSAMACEIIATILEKFSVKTEIIGFTTADWKGGRARKLWESFGRPRNPGRLNELRHIIYKHFNQNFKKAKINLGLMLKEGVLKENIDGEALLFARSRLMQQSEKRKIMLVISDGTPIDDSTALANDGDILSDHLRHVVNRIEKQSKIEIVGIGIGHSTDDFYRNSITIKSLEELGDVMIEKITALL